ncbi:unnamed protein product [Prorocentrum cordatum]|uniref:Uncharacterized protein n=1 Tax=Prorocentrum cordatum TaxID=2364126 RepID=A0ABN9WY50_9DINO|nr:unnamed protein product [Polarella glacialis]
MDQASFFLTKFVVDGLAEFIALGEQGVDIVNAFVGLASQLLQMPDDDEVYIEKAPAVALNYLQRVLKVVNFLDGVQPSSSTPPSVFADIQSVVNGPLKGNADGDPFAFVGKALDQEPFWKKKLGILERTATMCSHHFPEMNRVISLIKKLSTDPSADYLEKFHDYLRQVQFVLEAVGAEFGKDLEAATLNSLTTSVHEFLKQASDGTILPAIGAKLAASYIEVLHTAETVMPFSCEVGRCTEEVKKKKTELETSKNKSSFLEVLDSVASGTCSAEDFKKIGETTDLSLVQGDSVVQAKLSDALESTLKKLVDADAIPASDLELLESMQDTMNSAIRSRANVAVKHLRAVMNLNDALAMVFALGDGDIAKVVGHAKIDDELHKASRAVNQVKACPSATAGDATLIALTAKCAGIAEKQISDYQQVCEKFVDSLREAARQALAKFGSGLLDKLKADQWMSEINASVDWDEAKKITATVLADLNDEQILAHCSACKKAFEAYSEKSKELKLAVDAELKGTVDDALHWVQNVTFAYMVVKGKLDNEGSTNPAVDTREAMVQLQARMSEAGFVPGRRLPSVVLSFYRAGLRMA